jgi:hypothetical protein
MGKPLPHGSLGIDGGAPAPPLELPPAELPLDAELPVVVLGGSFALPPVLPATGVTPAGNESDEPE